MKNASLILNVILLAAVLFLYIDRFAVGKSKKPAETTEAITENQKPLQIVYINLDSLHSQSESFQAKKADLEKRQITAESALKAKASAFQREVSGFQQKAQSGSMTPKQIQEEEARLARKEQNIMAEQERVAKDILQDTDKFNEQFTAQVKTHLDSLKKAMNYDYILIYGANSPVLLANESFDITKTVVNLINKKG
jgi:outer membrane protein